MDKLVKQIKEELIEKLENGEGEGVYIYDLPHDFYNQDYYIIGTYKAKQFLQQNFDLMMSTIANNYKIFGDIDVKLLLDYERLTTLVVYYVADNIINALGNKGIDTSSRIGVNIAAEELINLLETIDVHEVVNELIRG